MAKVMTLRNPFATRFVTRNARAWAFRLHHEIDTARSNIYNDLREKLGDPDLTADGLRECLLSQRSVISNDRLSRQLEFADVLWRAQTALLEAQGVLCDD